MNFKKWVKSIQTAGYNDARAVYICRDRIPVEGFFRVGDPRGKAESWNSQKVFVI